MMARQPSAQATKIAIWVFLAADWVTFSALVMAAWVLGATSDIGAGIQTVPTTRWAMGSATALVISSGAWIVLGRRRRTYVIVAALAIAVLVATAVDFVPVIDEFAFGRSQAVDAVVVITLYHLLHVVIGAWLLMRGALSLPTQLGHTVLGWFWHAIVLSFLPIVWLVLT